MADYESLPDLIYRTTSRKNNLNLVKVHHLEYARQMNQYSKGNESFKLVFVALTSWVQYSNEYTDLDESLIYEIMRKTQHLLKLIHLPTLLLQSDLTISHTVPSIEILRSSTSTRGIYHYNQIKRKIHSVCSRLSTHTRRKTYKNTSMKELISLQLRTLPQFNLWAL